MLLFYLQVGSINEIIAFDNGPGNMVIDRFAEIITDGRYEV